MSQRSVFILHFDNCSLKSGVHRLTLTVQGLNSGLLS